MNSQGQQKGVDSLIVTDLIDLARNQAISDALLLSGDEDVRIGVQIAQGFGVRVHLLGIIPSRGSQSKQLLHEADTTTEWQKDVIVKFLTVLPPAVDPTFTPRAVDTVPPSGTEVEGAESAATIEPIVKSFVDALDNDQIEKLIELWGERTDVPPEYDGRLLAQCRDGLGRVLENEEKRSMREMFKRVVKERSN